MGGPSGRLFVCPWCGADLEAITPDISHEKAHVRDGSILSKKAFRGNRRNYLGPLTRFVRSDVRDHIASQKNDLGIGAAEYRSGRVVQKSTFARFLASSDFRLFDSIGQTEKNSV
jgi:hypothetical protein